LAEIVLCAKYKFYEKYRPKANNSTFIACLVLLFVFSSYQLSQHVFFLSLYICFLHFYLQAPKQPPPKSITKSRKKNSNSELSFRNNPQLLKMITSSRKKNNKLSSEFEPDSLFLNRPPKMSLLMRTIPFPNYRYIL
jgi:hypothetical protein